MTNIIIDEFEKLKNIELHHWDLFYNGLHNTPSFALLISEMIEFFYKAYYEQRKEDEKNTTKIEALTLKHEENIMYDYICPVFHVIQREGGYSCSMYDSVLGAVDNYISSIYVIEYNKFKNGTTENQILLKTANEQLELLEDFNVELKNEYYIISKEGIRYDL